MKRSAKIFSVLLLTAAAASCGSDATTAPGGSLGGGGGGGGGGTGSTSNAISVLDNRFNPASTTVPAGTTVTWTWSASNLHDVTFDDGQASNTQSTGTYQRTFPSAGTFNYHCSIHGASMSGSVTVQ